MSSLDNRKTLALENKIFSFKDGISYSALLRVFFGLESDVTEKNAYVG